MTPDISSPAKLLEIGKKLYAARRAKDEKLLSAANGIGIDYSILSKIERGKYPALKVDVLIRMVNYYHLGPEELVR